MCLILFSYKSHRDFPLIMLANRDEMYSRPTRPLHWWGDEASILAGKDEQEGGTWLGVTETGRFAALTNFRETGLRLGVKSRGHLTTAFLSGNQSPQQFLQDVDRTHQLYNGFNLLVGDKQGLYYYSNRERRIRELTPGFYGLSNHLLNSPWPKVTDGLAELKTRTEHEPDPASLFALLRNDTSSDDARLPNTGVGLSAERMLSPLFIKSNVYGTRSSCLVMLNKQGRLRFIERRYAEEGIKAGDSEFSFNFSA
ncbi:MAG: NRDE family protein [Pseudomonadales bacterium]|nr:NRDE family protein [Pseudomonadales bacterium]